MHLLHLSWLSLRPTTPRLAYPSLLWPPAVQCWEVFNNQQNTELISSICWCLWCKHLHCGQCQAVNMMSLNTELGRNTQQYIILALWNQEQDGTHSLVFRLWENLIYQNDIRQSSWLDLLKTFTLRLLYHFQGPEGSKKKYRLSSRSWCRANKVHNWFKGAITQAWGPSMHGILKGSAFGLQFKVPKEVHSTWFS